jgi:hypothetical protein
MYNNNVWSHQIPDPNPNPNTAYQDKCETQIKINLHNK